MTYESNLSTREQMYSVVHTATIEDFTAAHRRSDPDVVEVTNDESDTTHTVSLDTAQCSCDGDVESICPHMMHVLFNPNDRVTEAQHRLANTLKAYQEDVESELNDVRSRAHALQIALDRYDDVTSIDDEPERVTEADVRAVLDSNRRQRL